MTPLVQAAHDYLSAGLRVIALAGKAPDADVNPRGLADPIHGRPDGAADMALLEQLFTRPTTTGIGIVIDSPYVVIDVDGEEGARSLRDLVGTDQLDRTPVARTARGLHVWQAVMPPRVQRTTILGEKLDLKGVGGYVAAPPSVHPSGAVYEWLFPLVVAGKIVPPIEVRPEIIDLLDARQRVADDYRRLRDPDEPANVDVLASFVRRTEEGNRNGGLFWAAGKAAEGGVPIADAKDPLIAAALFVGLTREEAWAAIQSGYRRHRL